MKTLSILFMSVLTLAPFTTPLFAKAAEFPTDKMQKTKPATIKVLLQDTEDKIILEVKGPYKVFCPYNNVIISSGSSAKRGHMTTDKTGLFWGDSFPGSFGVRIVPSSSDTSILVNGIQYKGCLEVYDINGLLRVINEVDVENYLRSSLAMEFLHITEPEVLNALIIVARTQAYHQVHKYPDAPWHVTASEVNYHGHGNTLQNSPLEKAIATTRHAILTYHLEPFAASWSENTGGKTASVSTIFKDQDPTPRGVSIDGMEGERLRSSWSFQMSKHELAKLAKLSNVSNVSVFSEKESGKVYAVKMGDGQSAKTIDFFTLQNILGKTKLKSNDFTMEVLDQSVKFKGFGVGNGVGLCLHTAKIMAKQGLNAKKILSKFFVDTQIEKARTIPDSKEK
jgi:stage II sporulation protein D